MESLSELLNLCGKEDEEAIETLIRRFSGKALELAQALTRDPHLAEDAVQEAFLTALSKLDQLRDPKAFPGWFRQIVRTKANRIVRKQREEPSEAPPEKGVSSPPEELMEREELSLVIREALDHLPGGSRETVQLFYMAEHNCLEVAQILEIPEGTVKRRLHDARQKLKEMLLGYMEPLPAPPKKKENLFL